MIRREVLDRSLHYALPDPAAPRAAGARQVPGGRARHRPALFGGADASPPSPSPTCTSPLGGSLLPARPRVRPPARLPSRHLARLHRLRRTSSSPSPASSRARRSRRAFYSLGNRSTSCCLRCSSAGSVIYWLQDLCPVPVNHGPLAVIADPPHPWIAIPGAAASLRGAARPVGLEGAADGGSVRGRVEGAIDQACRRLNGCRPALVGRHPLFLLPLGADRVHSAPPTVRVARSQAGDGRFRMLRIGQMIRRGARPPCGCSRASH